MDYTMIRQYSRRAIISAALQDDEGLVPLVEVLDPRPPSIDKPQERMTGEQEAAFYKKFNTMLSPEDLLALVAYLNMTARPHRYFEAPLPWLDDAKILTPLVKLEHRVHIDKRTYSTETSHDGNSLIRFRSPQTNQLLTGNIIGIWTKPIDSKLTTFFVVRPHTVLLPGEEALAPFHKFHRTYSTRIFDATPLMVPQILEHQHIISHAVALLRPPGTYGINRKTVVVSWACNRDRR